RLGGGVRRRRRRGARVVLARRGRLRRAAGAGILRRLLLAVAEQRLLGGRILADDVLDLLLVLLQGVLRPRQRHGGDVPGERRDLGPQLGEGRHAGLGERAVDGDDQLAGQ